MNVKLISATHVKVGMYIAGASVSWWKITEVCEIIPGRITIEWKVARQGHHITLLREAHVLVGVP